MQPGILVVINRIAIGVPVGSMALIVKSDRLIGATGSTIRPVEKIHTVQILGSNLTRRYLARDLEVL